MSAVSMEPSVERWGAETRRAAVAPVRFRAVRNRVLAVLTMLALASSALAWESLPIERWLPLNSVALQGDLDHVSEAHLRAAIGPLLHGGLLGVNLTAVRLAVEALPWVDHATVHRVWPDTLRIRLVEQVAAARWGEAALLNERGEIFRPSPLPEDLPRLSGPSGSEKRVLEQFHRLHKQLEAIGLGLAGLALDARRSWTAALADKAVIRIGRDQIEARMRRFAAVWPRINVQPDRALRVADLRYPNGLSIRWGEVPGPGRPRGRGQ